MRGLTLNKLGIAAGIGSGPMSKLRQRGPADATVSTLLKVARAARVELKWFALGEGPMLPGLPAAADDRRQLAALLAEEAGVPRAAIEAVMRWPIGAAEEHRPTVWWVDHMRETALRRMRDALPDELPGPDESGEVRKDALARK